jgi:3-oxoacyl-[acyl-carrier protein] reductase
VTAAGGNLPLAGRTALVTGVSRRRGIGFAIARRLLLDGAAVAVQHFAAHDRDRPWGADDVAALVEELRDLGGPVVDVDLDLRPAPAARELVARAADGLGHLDILVCNHASSGPDGALDELGADALDEHWQVNARATLLLTQAFAARHDGRPGGRVVWLTSGQQLGPMPGAIAYAASKAALAGVTATVADELSERGILLNTVNPGPVNTGYLDGSGLERGVLPDGRARFPLGRFGEPDDPARLVAWLVSDEGRWMTGQVLSTEGGFRRG